LKYFVKRIHDDYHADVAVPMPVDATSMDADTAERLKEVMVAWLGFEMARLTKLGLAFGSFMRH
jgi:hypothetical protein